MAYECNRNFLKGNAFCLNNIPDLPIDSLTTLEQWYPVFQRLLNLSFPSPNTQKRSWKSFLEFVINGHLFLYFKQPLVLNLGNIIQGFGDHN